MLNFIKGIAIGAGAILPGISSGVLCVIFGIYNVLVDKTLNFFKNVKENFKFLLPIVLGAFFGIVIFGNILKYFFYNFPMQTQFTFLGLILGSMPILLKKANSINGFRLHYLLFLFISFIIAISLIIIEKNNFFEYISIGDFSFFYLVMAGFCMSIGVVVPGVSSSVILMILGVYYTYLDAISNLNIYILIPIGIGLFAGGFLFLKLIEYLLSKFEVQTYYCIIGFVIGSIFILYSKLSFNIEGLVSIICLLLGFFITKLFKKMEKT